MCLFCWKKKHKVGDRKFQNIGSPAATTKITIQNENVQKSLAKIPVKTILGHVSPPCGSREDSSVKMSEKMKQEIIRSASNFSQVNKSVKLREQPTSEGKLKKPVYNSKEEKKQSVSNIGTFTGFNSSIRRRQSSVSSEMQEFDTKNEELRAKDASIVQNSDTNNRKNSLEILLESPVKGQNSEISNIKLQPCEDASKSSSLNAIRGTYIGELPNIKVSEDLDKKFDLQSTSQIPHDRSLEKGSSSSKKNYVKPPKPQDSPFKDAKPRHSSVPKRITGFRTLKYQNLLNPKSGSTHACKNSSDDSNNIKTHLDKYGVYRKGSNKSILVEEGQFEPLRLDNPNDYTIIIKDSSKDDVSPKPRQNTLAQPKADRKMGRRMTAMNRSRTEDKKKNNSLSRESIRENPELETTYIRYNEVLPPKRTQREMGIMVKGKRTKINQYLLLETLGQGGYGTVYLAMDSNTKTKYAMKVIDRRKLESKSHPTMVEKMLKNEISILKSMNHDYIIKLIEALEDEATKKIYLVMEYCVNGTLLSDLYWERRQELVNNILDECDAAFEKKLDFNQATRYFIQLLKGLDYIHNDACVIHHDLKPENILVDADNNVKITDFGVSIKLEPEESDELTNYGWGTKIYLPPEYHNRQKIYGRAIDVWALGCIYYQMLFNCMPFGITNSIDEKELTNAVTNKELEFPEHSKQCLELDHSKNIIGRMLNKDPKARISTSQLMDIPFIISQLDTSPKYMTYSSFKHVYNSNFAHVKTLEDLNFSKVVSKEPVSIAFIKKS